MVPKELTNTIPKKVKNLVNRSVNGRKHLDEVLFENNLDYEDLRYTRNPSLQLINATCKTLNKFKKPRHGVEVVSFFSGCGGLDLGFETAGYEHVALIENNEIFCDTLRKNRDWEVLGPPINRGDVSKRYKLLKDLNALGVYENFGGVFVGGPPCQPFSIAANQRFSKNGRNFKRVGYEHDLNGNLLFDYIWFILKFRPRAFLIENVTGLIDIDGGDQISKAYRKLSNAGYKMHTPLKLNAAHYSVPQQRERVFIVGSLADKNFIPPKKGKEIIPCISALLNIDIECPNHITRKHNSSSIARYMELDVGKRDRLGRVDRLDPSLPAKTVIAGGSSGGGRSHLHPYIPRTLSVRECARLQTFPDDYVFTGSSARQFTQVGNAVPPILAAQLATAIYKSYFS